MISRAVDSLRCGGLVALPTETVYGLGADATNPVAVGRTFVAKGRPNTNPLIVHVADAPIARWYARSWPDRAEELTARFWPGPLTLVVPKAASIVPEVTAGRDTVGLRSPDHPLAHQLLREFDGPIAAPGDRSNRVSPTTAEHVRRELGDVVDLILDGGPCRVGIEFTVLDLTGQIPIILRPGLLRGSKLNRSSARSGFSRGVFLQPMRHKVPGSSSFTIRRSLRRIASTRRKGSKLSPGVRSIPRRTWSF